MRELVNFGLYLLDEYEGFGREKEKLFEEKHLPGEHDQQTHAPIGTHGVKRHQIYSVSDKPLVKDDPDKPGNVLVYHATSSKRIAQIKEKGIIPHAAGIINQLRTPKIYMAYSYDEAKRAYRYEQDLRQEQGKLVLAGNMVVLQVSVPKSELNVEKNDDITLQRTILPNEFKVYLPPRLRLSKSFAEEYPQPIDDIEILSVGLDIVPSKIEGGVDDAWFHDSVDGDLDEKWRDIVSARLKLQGVLKHLPGKHEQKDHGNASKNVVGLWKNLEDTYGDFPVGGKLLASYTDGDGYTITLTGGVESKNEYYGPISRGLRRYGKMHIVAPKGAKVEAGYWLNWPEKEWNISNKEYYKLSWEDRAALEVRQQATEYRTLRQQFNEINFEEKHLPNRHNQKGHGKRKNIPVTTLNHGSVLDGTDYTSTIYEVNDASEIISGREYATIVVAVTGKNKGKVLYTKDLQEHLDIILAFDGADTQDNYVRLRGQNGILEAHIDMAGTWSSDPRNRGEDYRGAAISNINYSLSLLADKGMNPETVVRIGRSYPDRGSFETTLKSMVEKAKITNAQKEAGNYKKKHIDFNGLDISIENEAGSTRSGKNKDGSEWSCKMHYDYGYIKRTEGVDGDHVDVYIGANKKAENVYVVHQADPKTGEYDEDKCMLGFDDDGVAKEAYLKQYDDSKFFGAMSIVPFSLFKEKVLSDKGEPVVPDAKRLVAGERLKSVISDVEKHLPSKHDQKKHGHDQQSGPLAESGNIIGVDQYKKVLSAFGRDISVFRRLSQIVKDAKKYGVSYLTSEERIVFDISSKLDARDIGDIHRTLTSLRAWYRSSGTGLKTIVSDWLNGGKNAGLDLEYAVTQSILGESSYNLFRGLTLSVKKLDDISVGSKLSVGVVSHWTTDEKAASSFSEPTVAKRGIIFRMQMPKESILSTYILHKRGANIGNVQEKEFVPITKNELTVTSIHTDSRGITYVDLKP